MHLDEEILTMLSHNQLKLIKALLAYPEGLLSSDLAAKTHVSNKSATLTPEVRELLRDHGYELIIEHRTHLGKGALWKLIKLQEEPNYIKIYLDEHLTIQVTRDKAIEIFEELKDSLGV